MKCRKLDNDHNAVWFGKTTDRIQSVWIKLNEKAPVRLSDDDYEQIFPSLDFTYTQEHKLSWFELSQIIFQNIGGGFPTFIFSEVRVDFNNFSNISFDSLNIVPSEIVITSFRRLYKFNLDGVFYWGLLDAGSPINGIIGQEIDNTVDFNVSIGKFTLSSLPADTGSADRNSYAINEDAIVASLTQRLLVLKGELWYQINFGIPLIENYANGLIFDMTITDIILQHPGVTGLQNFKSHVEGHQYFFTADILTAFGNEISISNNYLI